MKVRDLMSTPVASCQPDTDLASVVKLMWDRDCGFVPVVNEEGMLVGVITDRDICVATATRRLLPDRISAAQTMIGPVRTCLPDDTVQDVLATMKQFPGSSSARHRCEREAARGGLHERHCPRGGSEEGSGRRRDRLDPGGHLCPPAP